MNSRNYKDRGGDAIGSYISQMEKMKPKLAELSSQQGRLNEYNKSFKDWQSRLSKPSYSSISDSFNRMGLGRIGSLGGRMGELEKASMRLGEAAAKRKEDEQAREYAYQSALQSQRAREERSR